VVGKKEHKIIQYPGSHQKTSPLTSIDETPD